MELQQISIKELLDANDTRGATEVAQFIYCLKRSFLQQYRRILAFAWELLVATISGYLVGLAMQDLNGELYRGILIQPYSEISASPLELFVPQAGLIIGMAVCIAASPAGCNVFGQERVNYYREAASGHSKVSYFLAKTLASIPRIALASLHMCAIWFIMTRPTQSFYISYTTIFLEWYGIYGIGAIASIVLERENQAVVATLIGFIPTTLAGSNYLHRLWTISPQSVC
jgi:hypothetical protein